MHASLPDVAWLVVRNGLCGLLVGALIGVSGIGGGAVIQPLLILALGLPPVSAVGTGLLFATITKIGGAAAHLRLGNIRPRRTAFFLAGSLPTVLLVPSLVTRLSARLGPACVNAGLQTLMAVVLLATAVLVVAQQLLFRETTEANRWLYARGGPFPLRARAAAVAAGAGVGALMGATSVGGGVLIIPVMLWLNASPVQAVGSSIVISLVLSAAGGAVYFLDGRIAMLTVLTLAAGSGPGVLLGSRRTGRIPPRLLLAFVVLLITASGVSLLVHVLASPA